MVVKAKDGLMSALCIATALIVSADIRSSADLSRELLERGVAASDAASAVDLLVVLSTDESLKDIKA
ncbi:MAG: hypothetical protein ABJN42_10545 [Roseibium sp.]|uniref:hypothetical protein n=1 Tax=Roseibium sp. TaxID=1936156 RepID=UPI0032980843